MSDYSKPKGLKAPTAKTTVEGKPFKKFMGEVKVMNRINRDMDRTHASKVFDDEGNLRSKTNFNNSDQRFKRLSNRLISVQSRLDEGKIRGENIRKNVKGILRLQAKKLARKVTTSHPVAAVVAQALIPSKLGDGTIDGKKYKYDTSKLPKLKR